jgi:hypothetical protein
VVVKLTPAPHGLSLLFLKSSLASTEMLIVFNNTTAHRVMNAIKARVFTGHRRKNAPEPLLSEAYPGRNWDEA